MVENNDNERNAETGGRKRTRIFGGRKGAKNTQPVDRSGAEPSTAPAVQPQAATAPEAPVAPQVTTPAASAEAPAEQAVTAPAVADAAGSDTATAASSDASAETVTEAPEPAAPEAAATDAPAADAPVETPAPAAPAFPTALSTTSLIFHAPAIVPLPERHHADDDDEGAESSVRRRTRRRSGEDARDGDSAPANNVVKVRQPRQPELITEPQRVKGSTRLEAKKQRRRDGRDAGRRRTVITEAEFLARREAVDRQMVVRSKGGRIQIGVLEDSVLVEHYVARNQDASLIGNVYLGRVQNVLPSMEAAFVDIGRGRNAVLYSGEVDWEAAAAENPGGNQPRRIELALKPGDTVLVQVTKDPVGHKGARLTSQISLPGRYLVYVPNGSMNGISRKLPDTERARLKKILKEVLPDNNGVIVRTAAEGATEEQLTLDVNRLIEQWAAISSQVGTLQAPALLHSEPDLLIKIVRDVFNEDFQKMIIAGDEAKETIVSYLRAVAPDLVDRVESYDGDRDSFDQFRITEQIEKALDRKVWLPSGGSLVIDRTEAMTVVDVNTGKFVGSGGNLEETVTKNNLEAAEEIVRQLRLRDIGGIIVVDFIDMVLESNRDLVLRRLIECLSRDRTKHQVAEVTSLGLVQMTRKKLGLGLLESFSEGCEVCAGRGVIVHHDPVVKHRQTPQPQQSPQNRRRGGSQPATGSIAVQPGADAKAAGTHGITEDAKNALALIAASTLHPHEAEAAAAAVVAQDKAAQQDKASQKDAAQNDAADTRSAGADGSESGSSERKSRRGRRGRSGAKADGGAQSSPAQNERAPRDDKPAGERAAGSAGAAGSASEKPDVAAASAKAPVALIEIPVKKESEAPRQKAPDAAKLLDSVLESLPAPKQPGQGRSRSRRVTTAALSTTPVEPIVTGTSNAGE